MESVTGKYSKKHFTCFLLIYVFLSPAQFTADDGVTVLGMQTVGCHYVPNAFLMSVLLFIGTFLIAYHLKNFKSASFFPAKVINVFLFFCIAK